MPNSCNIVSIGPYHASFCEYIPNIRFLRFNSVEPSTSMNQVPLRHHLNLNFLTWDRKLLLSKAFLVSKNHAWLRRMSYLITTCMVLYTMTRLAIEYLFFQVLNILKKNRNIVWNLKKSLSPHLWQVYVRKYRECTKHGFSIHIQQHTTSKCSEEKYKLLTATLPSNNSHTIKTMHAQDHHHVQRLQHLQMMSKPLIHHIKTKSIPRVQIFEYFGQDTQHVM